MGVGLASDRALRLLMHPEFREMEIFPTPPDDCIQPASIDLHLSNKFGYLKPKKSFGVTVVDPLNPPPVEELVLSGGTTLRVEPGDFVLGSTVERVTLSRRIVGVVDGKSSLGRCGLSVHITAGYVDPGFDGNITLELKNETRHVILLTPGMRIAQFRVYELQMPCARPYGHPELKSHYVNEAADGTVGPRAQS